MPIEQRVVASGSRPVGGIRERRPAVAAVEEAPEKTKKKRKLKLPSKRVLIIAGAVVLVVLAAVYFLLLTPAGGPSKPAPTPAPVPGAVVKIDSVSVNLADGHYLRLGLALQLTAAVGEESPDPAHALDLAITMFSGHTLAEVTDPATRDKLKAELTTKVSEAYEGKVMAVYLTDYVTQ